MSSVLFTEHPDPKPKPARRRRSSMPRRKPHNALTDLAVWRHRELDRAFWERVNHPRA